MLKITFVEHGVTPPDGGWDTRQDPESTPSLGKKNGFLFGESTWKSEIDMVNCQSNGISLIIDSVTNEDANINVVLVPDLICAEVPLGFVDGQKVRFRGNVPNVGTDFQAKIELKPCAD